MLKHLKLSLLPMMILSFPSSALESIDIFTVDGLEMPVAPLQKATGITPELHKIDELKRIEDGLSQGLPNSEKEATAIVMKRFQDPAFIEQSEISKRGMDAVILADQLKLEAVPAVVFDRRYIVYGEQPLVAYRIYQKHKEAKQ